MRKLAMLVALGAAVPLAEGGRDHAGAARRGARRDAARGAGALPAGTPASSRRAARRLRAATLESTTSPVLRPVLSLRQAGPPLHGTAPARPRLHGDLSQLAALRTR